MRAVGVVVLMVLLGGCVPEQACTLIGDIGGVGVRVEAGMPVDELELTVCPAAVTCRTATVRLDPDYDSDDQGCSGPRPDEACSATAVPNGRRVGYVEWSDLPTGPVTVRGRVTDDGRTSSLAAVELSATTAYPNGPDCGAGANHAAVALGPTGLRAA